MKLCDDTHLDGNALDWYTKGSQANGSNAATDRPRMTEEEFATFFFTGKCSVHASSLASALGSLVDSKRVRVTMGGKVIAAVLVCHQTVFLPYTPNVPCYEDPQVALRKPDPAAWDCDRIATPKHSAPALRMEDGSCYLFDPTAAQYGIMTRNASGRFLHTEEIRLYDEMDEERNIGSTSFSHVYALDAHDVAWRDFCDSRVVQVQVGSALRDTMTRHLKRWAR